MEKISKSPTNQIAKNNVKAELERKGYLVSPLKKKESDFHFIIETNAGEQFFIIVSGLKKSNFWLVKNREIQDDLYYFLVFLSTDTAPKFFILTSYEMIKEREAYKQHIEEIGGKYNDLLGGINWKAAFIYENHWDILPK